MKRYSWLWIAAAILPIAAQAGTSPGTPVTDIYALAPVAILLLTPGPYSGVPACATQTGRWAIDSTTAAGKAQYNAVLTAFALGKNIEAFGTNTCSVWADTETISTLHVY